MFGPVTREEAEKALMDGSAWADFCQFLAAAGTVLERGPDDPQTRVR